ncbi:MAG: hypothetical protein GY729_02125 [Desulfobacteraceae bacterium]|nr:hypothetical protein [Desulfobacteraceae bacterium]
MQFLKTKFHIPDVEKEPLVKRVALLKDLGNGRSKELILVCAPAGFGKSTFVSQWIHDTGLVEQTAWLSLEDSENDPVLFWAYVMGSLNNVAPHICDSPLMQLQAASAAGLEDVLISMINQIQESGQPFLLVLDDYHLINNPVIHDSLNFFIDHPCDNLTLVISSRKKPFPGLSRLRVSGRLKEITEKHLRFSSLEIIQFIKKFANITPDPKQARLIGKKTEGWIAALKLAMISFQENKAVAFKEFFGNDRFIQDYLMEEVYLRLPEKIRAFIAKISFLDRFCPDLCTAATNDLNADKHIHYMLSHHLFLIALDDKGNWYRFHHLFQDFLKKRLEKEMPDTICRIHENAHFWFEDNNYFDEAFHHALAAERQDLAAKVLAKNIPELYGERGEQPFIEIFLQLSLTHLMSEPVLACYYFGFQTFCGQFDVLDEMKTLMDKDWNKKDKDLLQGFYTGFCAYQAFYIKGDIHTTIDKGNDALRLIPLEHGSLRKTLEFLVTLSHRFLGQIEPAIKLAQPRDDDNLIMSALVVTNRAHLEVELGNLTYAEGLITDKISIMERIFQNTPPPSCGFLYLTYGLIYKEKNQLAEARKAFEKCISIINQGGFLELIIVSYSEYARVLALLKEFDKAHEAVDHAIRLGQQTFSWLEKYYYTYKVDIWLKEKKIDLIKPWADEFKVKKGLSFLYYQSEDYLILASYLMVKQEWDKVNLILDFMIAEDEQDHRHGRLIQCYVLKAKAMYLTGDKNEAEVFLTKAFEIARNQGHALVFVKVFKDIKALFETCRQKKLIPQYLYDHLDFKDMQTKPAQPKTVEIYDFKEHFNTRELDILKLFQKGVSNKEAADILCLSVNTVRWYASKIFLKLDVKRRGQAVSRAVQLDLI